MKLKSWCLLLYCSVSELADDAAVRKGWPAQHTAHSTWRVLDIIPQLGSMLQIICNGKKSRTSRAKSLELFPGNNRVCGR